jgi:hypothetical protein
MYVSRELLEPLLGGRQIDCIADRLGISYDWLVEALHLPAGTRITGVSVSLRFDRDQVALRVEHPDFVETIPGNVLPEVGAWYGHGVLSWTGPAVGTPPTAPEQMEDWFRPVVKFREFL